MFSIEGGDFIVMDRGRHNEEQSLILIENGNFSGYGYMDAADVVIDPEDLRRLIKRQLYHPDTNDLVRSWMRQNPKAKKVQL